MSSSIEWKAFAESSDKTAFADKLATMEKALDTLQPTWFRIARYLGLFLGKGVTAALAVLAVVGVSQNVLLTAALENMLPEMIKPPVSNALPQLVGESLKQELPPILAAQLPAALQAHLDVVQELNRLAEEARVAHSHVLERKSEVDSLLESWSQKVASIEGTEGRDGTFRDVALVWSDGSKYKHVTFVVPVRMPTDDYEVQLVVEGEDFAVNAYVFGADPDSSEALVIHNTRYIPARSYFVVTWDIENDVADYVVADFRWYIK